MPKRKKIEGSYNNIVKEEENKKYFNQWVNNPNDFGFKMYSYIIHAEATSAIQIIVCSNPLYNGIFHLTKFEFKEKDGQKIIQINDFELLKESKDNSFNSLISYITDIAEKYSGEIVETDILMKNPLEQKMNYTLNDLIMG